MRFDTDAVFKLSANPLVAPGGGLGPGGGGWTESVMSRNQGRFGSRAGYGAVEVDGDGNLISDRAGQRAARAGRGAAWSERLTVPVYGESSNSTPEMVVNYDISRSGGLQGSLQFVQEIEGVGGAKTLTHTNIQNAFPNMASAQAKIMAGKLRVGSTSEGDFSEIFYRLLVMASDYWAGATHNPRGRGGTTYGNAKLRMWPQGVGVNDYDPLMLSFGSVQRVYYLPGCRHNAPTMTTQIVRTLWTACGAYMCHAAGTNGSRNAYSLHAQFADRIMLFFMGPQDRYAVHLGGNDAVPIAMPNAEDCLATIDWLIQIVGHRENLDSAICAFAERIPFASLRSNCTGCDPIDRCAQSMGAMGEQRLTVLLEMADSINNGVVNGALAGAYDAVFGANTYQAGWAMPPGLDWTGVIEPLFTAAAWSDDVLAILRGALDMIGRGENVASVMRELTRHELVKLTVAFEAGSPLPFRMVNHIGRALSAAVWPAVVLANYNAADRRTSVASSGRNVMPAQGMLIKQTRKASNGLSSWIDLIESPSKFHDNDDMYHPKLFGNQDEVFCSLGIVACYMRALADCTARFNHRTPAYNTLACGGEPVAGGAAAVWTPEQRAHSQEVFTQTRITSVDEEVSALRGMRRLLWPGLTSYVGAAERARTSLVIPDLWELSVALTPLQTEVLTGIGSGVGGLIHKVGIYGQIAREGKHFLNRSLLNSDLSRANRLHLMAIFTGACHRSVTLEYQVRYQDEEYARYDNYAIPMGTLKTVRSEATYHTGEKVSSMMWLDVMASQSLTVTNMDILPAAELIVGKNLAVGVCSPNWWDDGNETSPITDYNPISCSITTSPQHTLTDGWRSKGGAIAAQPAVAAGADMLENWIGMLQGQMWRCRFLQNPGALDVVTPWVIVRTSSESYEMPLSMFEAETGANRFVQHIRNLAGLDPKVDDTRSVLIADNRAGLAAGRQAENAPQAVNQAQLMLLTNTVEEMRKTLELLASRSIHAGVDVDRGGAGDGPPIPAAADDAEGIGDDAFHDAEA
jgi:hypothetical protein